MSSVGAVALPLAPSFRLDGKRALVTGAGRGIGLGAAAALAAAGAHVTLAARTEKEIVAAADAIVARGDSADALVLDVLDVDAVASAIDRVAPFDILVNNAGTNRPKPMLDTSPADFDAVMDLNVRATYFVSRAVVARLASAQRPGSIIHVSSQMGLVGATSRSVYCASKWAIEGLTRAMAVELGPLGVRVNAICPTFVETPMTMPFLADASYRASVLAKIKLGRLGRVEDLLGGIVFLASDAAALMTGSSLVIDGGWTAD